MSSLASSPHAAVPSRPHGRSPGARAFAALLRNPLALAGIAILVLTAVVAALAGVIAPGDPLDMAGIPLQWPGDDAAHRLGTDSLGRDVFSGLVHGTRASLMVGLSAASISLAIGVVVGAVGGYFGGRTDNVLVRVTELFQTVPAFLLVIVLVAIHQPTLPVIQAAIGLASWPEIARLVRAEFRVLRDSDFVLAARASGFGPLHIIWHEVLPNALPPLIVTTSILIASAILAESGLSFLGMSDPNVVSWGGMIGGNREHIGSAWFLTALPGAAIATVVLAFNLLGDGLNDALNPRLRRRSA
ncbi:ABC transporter permease [Pseudorhodoferax sp. Leaf274]|uniref:ABC transporter permease n=1 Tax=Pseudorhodoferax sp. Leaf274 TaxID=1736318 RepID=UPI000702D302|nr:ABC transporter permease [Pseudorhodoferax sp. Leaf274]KQP47717.1 ABC transporter permease [Pseudorhodoferax sp. Leaf274]